MIKAIIFDLGDVFIIDDLSMKKFFKITKINPKELEVASEKHFHKFDTAKIDAIKFWNKIVKDLNLPKKGIYYSEMMTHFYSKHAKINKRLESLVKKLKRKGYKIAILSNRPEPAVKVDREKGWYDHFSDVVVSSEIGIRKPDKRIYKILLRRLKMRPEECVFVDNDSENLIPARSLGMKTILFKNVNQTKIELKKIGIKF